MFGTGTTPVNGAMERINDIKLVQKDFLAKMSYEIRNPLNAICGISEIACKNIETEGDRDMLKSYLEIIRDSAMELQNVVDNRFAQFEAAFSDIIEDETKDIEIVQGDYDILKNLRVMVVEDTDVGRLVAKQLLEEHGAIVTECASGEECIEKFESSITGTYDIILMDIKMPGIDGYEATNRIRNLKHAQAKSIPIIAMTAEAFVEDVQNAIRAGMNGHISKPVHLDKIVAAIKKAKM